MELIRLGLQFFAEGAAAAAPAATAANGAVAAPANGETNTETSAPTEPDLDAEYRELVKTKYKAQHDRDLSDTVQNRLKSAKAREAALNEENSKYRAFVEKMYDEYDADDLDSLEAKLREDRPRRIEDEAIKTGKSNEDVEKNIDARAELRRAKRESERYKAERDAERRKQESSKILADWRRQAEGLAEKYPGFDLDAELENEVFVDLLVNGKGRVTVENAYVSAHFDEAIKQAMEFAAARGTEVAAARFANNAKRPAEGALQKTTAGASVVDVKNMTRKQRDEIKKRVEKGERITFG